MRLVRTYKPSEKYISVHAKLDSISAVRVKSVRGNRVIVDEENSTESIQRTFEKPQFKSFLRDEILLPIQNK